METLIAISVPLTIASLELVKKYFPEKEKYILPVSIFMGTAIVWLISYDLDINIQQKSIASVVTILGSNGLYDHIKSILPFIYKLKK